MHRRAGAAGELPATVAGEVSASLATWVRRTWKDQEGNEFEHFQQLEKVVQVENLVTGAYPVASITKSCGTKISHAEYWGPGTWDKIPYSVEVLTSVTLNCDQTQITMIQAANLAEDLALAGIKDQLGQLLVAHSEDIRTRLFKHLFEEDDG